MRTRYQIIGYIVAVLVGMAIPSAVSGQVPWDTPALHSPAAPGGLGVHFVNYGVEPRDGNGVLVSWRGEQRGWGWRGGFAEGAEETTAYFGGLEYSVPLSDRDDEFPFDLAFLVGAGVGYGEYGLASVPVGLSAGWDRQYESVWVNPYLSGRLVFDRGFGGNAPDDEIELNVGLDAGVDLGIGSDPSIVLRASVSMGDRQSVALGVAFPKLGR